MVRVVELQHSQGIVGQFVHFEYLVRFREQYERFRHGRRLLVVLDYVSRAVSRRHERAAAHIEVRDIDFMLREYVP